MTYCDKIADAQGWPKTVFKFVGTCEACPMPHIGPVNGVYAHEVVQVNWPATSGRREKDTGEWV